MILSTTKELRLHAPSVAIDNLGSFQGILDNSEKDFLLDKLGAKLYQRLCEYYESISPDDFYLDVTGGTYAATPYKTLLLYAQRMVVFDALSRFAPQQAVSVNSTGINMASSNDYDTVSDKMLDKSVQGYKKEAMVSLNNLLVLLEGWAGDSVRKTDDSVLKTNDSVQKTDDSVQKTDDSVQIKDKEEIVNLWQESKFYFLHSDLLIPTALTLQQYVDIYDNRDRFIRLLPDLHFIQDEYITEAIGEDTITQLLHSTDPADQRLLRKVQRLMVAHLKDRTTVIAFDKQTRQQAHDDVIALRTSILKTIKERTEQSQPSPDTKPDTGTTPEAGSEGYKNNEPGSKIFVSPMLY